MPRVLIVEDNLLNLELARDVLEAQGWYVRAAGNAAEARLCLATGHPDLVLMDVQLPGMNGLDLTRALRADPLTRDLVIVAMTAHAMAEDEHRVREAGCDGYLTKPLQTRTFAQQLAAFLPHPATDPGFKEGQKGTIGEGQKGTIGEGERDSPAATPGPCHDGDR